MVHLCLESYGMTHAMVELLQSGFLSLDVLAIKPLAFQHPHQRTVSFSRFRSRGRSCALSLTQTTRPRRVDRPPDLPDRAGHRPRRRLRGL